MTRHSENSFRNTLADMGIDSEFVTISRHVNGVLYRPFSANEKTRIGIMVMHSGSDYMARNILGMAKYGYTVLCANASDYFGNLDNKIADLRDATEYLRSCEGVTKVVLWGHSGGATLMTAYQRMAENGVSSCQGPEKIHKASDELKDMTPADGVMLIDANCGNALMSLFSMDPAVVAEDGSAGLDPELDLFNEANGFREGGTTFSEEFKSRFLRTQGARMNRLIEYALSREAMIDAGESFYEDDEPFNVIGAANGFMNNKLYAQDLSLFAHTHDAWPLIHKDGNITNEVVKSLRDPENDRSFTHNLREGTLNTTIRNFLSEFAIRTLDDYSFDEDSIRGVDWQSTYSTPVGNVESISAPLLVMGMTAGWEFLASEQIYDHAASKDKHLAFVEGATHPYTTKPGCEDLYGDTLETVLSYADKWLSEPGRFTD